MRIFRHCTELPVDAKGGVIVLGNFDGVHKGHQAVIGEGLRIAREQGVPCGVMTFEPHPRTLFKSDPTPFRLTPFRIKAHMIEALGVDYLYMQHFDKKFAEVSAEDFVEAVLCHCLKVTHVVIGHDYVFGHGRRGNLDMMLALGETFGFGVTEVPPVGEDHIIYSSTEVRDAITRGQPREAAHLLGRYWEVEGRVEHGDARGQSIGFPTANLHLGEYQNPAKGVYAVMAGVDHGEGTKWHQGVANFGNRPTFDKTSVLLEVHLFDFAGDLYNLHLRVALVDYIRPEKKFDGLEALKAQIALDAEKARDILAGIELPQGQGQLIPAP